MGAAEAENIRLMGAAEAEAIKLRADALKQNPLLVELITAENGTESYHRRCSQIAVFHLLMPEIKTASDF